jgi:hypothetical protein
MQQGLKPGTVSLDCANLTRCSRVLSIEFGNLVGCMDLILIHPLIVLIAPTLPLDKELQATTEKATVEDSFHLVFLDIINQDWGWCSWRSSSREWVKWSRGEFDHMENWMESLQDCWQFKTIGIWANLGLDWEWPQVTM